MIYAIEGQTVLHATIRPEIVYCSCNSNAPSLGSSFNFEPRLSLDGRFFERSIQMRRRRIGFFLLHRLT